MSGHAMSLFADHVIVSFLKDPAMEHFFLDKTGEQFFVGYLLASGKKTKQPTIIMVRDFRRSVVNAFRKRIKGPYKPHGKFTQRFCESVRSACSALNGPAAAELCQITEPRQYLLTLFDEYARPTAQLLYDPTAKDYRGNATYVFSDTDPFLVLTDQSDRAAVTSTATGDCVTILLDHRKVLYPEEDLDRLLKDRFIAIGDIPTEELIQKRRQIRNDAKQDVPAQT